jgi:hypothetical protein
MRVLDVDALTHIKGRGLVAPLGIAVLARREKLQFAIGYGKLHFLNPAVSK